MATSKRERIWNAKYPLPTTHLLYICIPHCTSTHHDIYIPHPTSHISYTFASHIAHLHGITSPSHMPHPATSASHIQCPRTPVALCKDTSEKQKKTMPPWHLNVCLYPPPLAQARPRSQKSRQNDGSRPTPCLDKAVHAGDTCASKAHAGLEPYTKRGTMHKQLAKCSACTCSLSGASGAVE